jgi:hypothetical protein
MGHGPELAGEIGGRDHIDAGEGQEQDIGRAHQEGGAGTLQGLNFLGFPQAIIVQGQGDLAVLLGGAVGGRRPLCPGQDGVEGAFLETNLALAEKGAQSAQTRLAEGGGGSEVPDQQQGTGMVPEIVEAGRLAWVGRLQVFADLTT